MKLYFSPGACSLSVRIIAHELGIKLQYEWVDIHGTHKTETGIPYDTINVKGSVPALQLDNGQVLTENIAIQQYLADTHPSPMLPNLGDFQRYRVIEWMSFMASDVHKGFGPLFSDKVPADLKQNVFIPSLKRVLSVINQQLAKHTYLTGEQFTLPDAYCFVMMRWLAGIKIPLNEFPHIERFFNTVSARPAVAAAMDEERKRKAT